MILWAYPTNYKQLKRKTPFKLVYGQETVMLMEYIIPILRIAVATGMDDEGVLEECMTQLL